MARVRETKEDRIAEFEQQAAVFLPMIAAQFASGKTVEDFPRAAHEAIVLFDAVISAMDDSRWFDD
jgi:hypothetical protein